MNRSIKWHEILEAELTSLEQQSQTPDVHPAMAGRLGEVLSFTANIIALAVIGFFAVVAGNEPNVLVFGLCAAAVVWATGRVLHYILARL
jgi:hypothetical protein